MEVRCLKCGKKPAELEEYVDAAKEEGLSPEAYVVQEEGTYNHNTGYFWCTPCYVEIGMPLGRAREGVAKSETFPYPDTHPEITNFLSHVIKVKE